MKSTQRKLIPNLLKIYTMACWKFKFKRSPFTFNQRSTLACIFFAPGMKIVSYMLINF